MKKILLLLLIVASQLNTVWSQVAVRMQQLSITDTLEIAFEVKGDLSKQVFIELVSEKEYANIILLANKQVLVDNLDVPSKGIHRYRLAVKFTKEGPVNLQLIAEHNQVFLHELRFDALHNVVIPEFSDISEKAGLDRVNTIKYGGPCVADIDQDGDYDFIVTNHNDETNKLYWNNGDGTVTKHNQDLSRWYMEDLHGASCADYDNDGDLDIIQTRGGGNGKNPSLPEFYRNDNGKLVLSTLDVGITAGARGRGARWSDMDLDGDLDIMFVNAKGIAGETPQHLFYRNKGDGTFEIISVEGIENADAQRALITDVNGDNVDDIVLYDPTNTIWLGNGDFTFTNATNRLPQGFSSMDRMMGVTDIDIDNDGDFDLYYARGNAFGVGVKPSFDFCPVHMRVDIKIRNKGSFELKLEADNDIGFHDYDFVGRNGFKGEDFPIYIGKNKASNYVNKGGSLLIEQSLAEGWPNDISSNGIYFGHIGSGEWRSAVVINGDIFWNVNFNLQGVKNAMPLFIPANLNQADVLLRNDGNKFTNVSDEWNIPSYGNHSGVAVGDFNNDGRDDLFLHRWGHLQSKPSDYMLLNTGAKFELTTNHGASAAEDEGHGDMGQVFDFDLDGDVDMLNGSDEYGMWYLYANQSANLGNYALVKVGYAPHSNVDALSAEVIVETPQHTYRKRVGSSGEIFSQSLLNIVHFGLANEETINKITIKWRDGETVVITDKKANQLFDTDNVEPQLVKLDQTVAEVRKGTAINLSAIIEPINANKEFIWSSSDESLLTVEQDGKVSALGKHKKIATITATSKANGLSASADVKIVKWYALAVEEIILKAEDTLLYEGHDIRILATVFPNYADNPSLKWTSSNPGVATVNELGLVHGLTSGDVVISAISLENNAIEGTVSLKVLPYIKPGLEIVDEEKFTVTEFVIGETMDITVNYSAGSGNKVVSQDLGGVKIWFRQLNDRWMASGNYDMPVDKTALGKESGSFTTTIKIGEDLVPTSELPADYVYYLYVGMASSNGELYTKEIYPIKIKKSHHK